MTNAFLCCSVLTIFLACVKNYLWLEMPILLVLAPYILFVGFEVLVFSCYFYLDHQRRREWFDGLKEYNQIKRREENE